MKSAFTRQYNKESHKTPYAVHQTAKKAKGKTTSADDILVQDGDEVGEENPVEDDNDEDVTKDAMVKVKKEPASSSKTKTNSKNPPKATTSSKSKIGKGKKK